MKPHESTRRQPGVRARLLLMLAAALSVLVPFLFWNGTWFGRKLTDQQMQIYLHDSRHPRGIQHALSQTADRIIQHDPAVIARYPDISALTQNPLPEVRSMAAWVMGQDNRSEEFHKALLSLLGDAEVTVRRNAALALLRFGDDAGHAELLRVLQPWIIKAPAQGSIRIRLEPGQTIGRNTLLARMQSAEGRGTEVRSPVSGRVVAVFASDNSRIEAGARLVSLRSESDEVWEALRGLYLVGRPEDLSAVEEYASVLPAMPDPIRQQAARTARAIRTRSEPNPIR